MEESFEELINSFLETKLGLSNNFLQANLALKLKENLLARFERDEFEKAGIGNYSKLSVNNAVRSDVILWLDRSHNNNIENDFLDLIDDFVRYLNLTCYTGITSHEFHFSIFEKGTFYKKHVDQFNNNSQRQYSMICYLNDAWLETDGGQLLVHGEENNQLINPNQGKTVFFKSDELFHEVLVTNKRRISITGWLKKD